MKSTGITVFTLFWVTLFIILPSTASAINLVTIEPATIYYTTNDAAPASTDLGTGANVMSASANTDTAGIYLASDQPYFSWQGTYADRLGWRSTDYDFRYGDEQSFIYTLPWLFTFFEQSYGQITIDTNGNIWFANSAPAHSFNLVNTGKGPVIAAWNNDLNSTFYGGAFVQHKINPERVVVEWLAETYEDAGFNRLNNFEVVLYPDGKIGLDYKSFNQTTNRDFGSGISLADGTHYVEIANSSGGVYTLAERSILLTPYTSATYTLSVGFTGAGKGNIVSNPMELGCNTNCSALFAAGTDVTLYHSPSIGSIFKSWGGACSGVGTCTVNMNSDRSVTAQFDLNPSQAVRNETGGISYYSTLQNAYDLAAPSSLLKVLAFEFNEDLNANQSKTITLSGGYNSDYTAANSGDTVIRGSLTVSSGMLILNGIVIQ